MTTTDVVLMLCALGLILVGVIYLLAWSWHLSGRVEELEGHARHRTRVALKHGRQIGTLEHQLDALEHAVERMGEPA